MLNNKKYIQLKNYKNNKYYYNLHSIFLKKLLSCFLKKGKKAYASKLVNNLKWILKKKTKIDSNLLFVITLLNSLTSFYFIKKKKGGSLKEIPMPITYKRQSAYIIKILKRITMSKRTFNPSLRNVTLLILLTCKNKGPLIARKYKNYRKAFDNKFLLNLIRK